MESFTTRRTETGFYEPIGIKSNVRTLDHKPRSISNLSGLRAPPSVRKISRFYQGGIQRQGTQATNRPTQMILTNLSLRVELPSRLGYHLISWKSINSNHTSIKLAQSMFPNDCDRWPPWYLGFEKIRREVGENRLSGPVGCLCPLSLYTPLTQGS